MAVDPRYGNSSGYFKDPITEEDFSPDTPRVVQAELIDGKFIWPRVARSDGDELLKIVFRCFTDEEKRLYNLSRGRSGGSVGHSQVRKPKADKAEPKAEPVTPEQVIKYDKHSAIDAKSLEVIKQCDILYGISFIAGIMYALIGKKNDKVTYFIPRSCIPDSEFQRLNDNIGVS